MFPPSAWARGGRPALSGARGVDSTVQTATTHEISSNIGELQMVMNQTADGAHQSARAAHQLNVLASDLKGLVERFRLA